MSSNSDDIQAAGSDTRSPMLDRTDYESWSQRIRLYCRRKENGLQILQSIDQGPFELGTTRDILGTTPKGDVRATNIVLQGLPKDIYKLINHNIEAKAIWDNVKMLLADGWIRDTVKLNKGLKETNHEQLYAYLKQHEKHAAKDRLIIERITPVTNDQLNQNQNQRYLARGNGAAGNEGTQNRARNANAAQENGAVLDEEELLFLAGEQADECDAFDSDVDDEPTAQSIFMVSLSSAGSANPQASPSNASILSEVHILENAIDNSVTNLDEHEIHNEVQQANVIDSTSVDVGNSNVIPYEQYLSVDNISVVPSCASFTLNDVCVLSDNYAFVPHDPIATKLKIYKEQVAIYEQRAKFELTEREHRMDDQMQLLKTHHVPVNVPSSEEELELAETTRNKLHAKMNDFACVEKRDFEKTCKKRITPTGITEGERGFEQAKRCYLTEVILFFNLLKEHFDKVQKSLVTEVRAMKAVFENLEAEVDQNEIDLKSGEIEQKNLLITNENLITECLSKDVFYTATDSVLNVSRFSDMHDAFTIAQKRIADLESENFNLRNKIQNDDHDSMIKHFSKLEVEHFNLQLKYQNLKERFGNKKPVTSSDAPSFDSLFALVSKNKDLTAKLNALHDLNESFRAENAKVKQHYKELYDSIKITHAKTTDQNNSLLSEIENLKAQLKDNSKCVTIPDSKPKVLAPGVNGASAASRSKPRSNTKKDRTLPAKSALKQVEAHSRMKKSNEKQKNRVDSSISYKRTETDIQEKDKNQSQNDKTEHKNRKTVRSQKDHVKVNEKFKVKINPGK
ncbi:hypothetical protein Tco_1142885 [Tanacetum coccineum]